MLNEKTILITGGTGSFAQKFTETVLKLFPRIKTIIIFSRDRHKQKEMGEKFPNAPLEFIAGDIARFEDIEKGCKATDIIIHTAAMRLVPETEANPWKAVETNVIGAQNLIKAALKYNVKQILALSTDMASLANNTYGATKMIGDKLFIATHAENPSLKTAIIRYGNMFGSTGTVIPFFIKKSQEEGILPVTDTRMTRFMATLEECVKIAIEVLYSCLGGEIISPKLKSYNIVTIAKAVDEKAELKVVGLRPGEKLYEIMVTPFESHNTIENKNYYIILPSYANKELFCKHYHAHSVPIGFEFNSENNPDKFSIEDIKELISKSNF